MTTTSRMFRMKTVKKLGLPLWPWRQMNSKQAQKLEKSGKFQNKQIDLLQKKKKRSQFAYQLKSKQLIAALYGNLQTQYFTTVFNKSSKLKGKTSLNFLQMLEKRLDSILYRACFAPSMQASKQLINHRKVLVNNQVIAKPGYIVQPGDVISMHSEIVEMHAKKIRGFLQAPATQQALQTVSSRFIRGLPNAINYLSKRSKKQNPEFSYLKQSENKYAIAKRKVFYKPIHLEINYQTLHIVYLFAPQQLHFPVMLPLQNIARVFSR